MIRFSGPKGLHEHLLRFCADSAVQVSHEGEEVDIYHSQFASFNLREAFRVAVEQTDLDPRTDSEAADELEDVIEDASGALTDRDLRHQYTPREYFEPRDLQSAARDYHTTWISLQQGEQPLDSVRPRATTRAEAIAEVFSRMLALRAEREHTTRFMHFGDEDDDTQPDPGYDGDLIKFALRDTSITLHGPSTFRQPDPSFHYTQTVFEIYDGVGMEKNVRAIYGDLVAPSGTHRFEPDDATGRKLSKTMGRTMKAAAGMAPDDPDKKWASVSEPPLESLESYDPPE